MRLRDAVDQAFEAQPPQVVGHLRGRVRAPEERFDLGPEIAIAESAGEMGEAGEGLQSAMTRGSPKRSAEARWPASTVGAGAGRARPGSGRTGD